MNCFTSVQRHVFNVPLVKCPCSQRAPLLQLLVQKAGHSVISQTLFLEVEQLFLSGTRHWHFLLFVSKKMIFWFCRHQLTYWAKHPTVQHTSVLFLNLVLSQPPASHFPSPAMGTTMVTLLCKALWDLLVKISYQLRARSTQALCHVARVAPLLVQIPTGHLKHSKSWIKLLTLPFLASEVFREQEWPPSWVNKLWLKKLVLQP